MRHGFHDEPALFNINRRWFRWGLQDKSSGTPSSDFWVFVWAGAQILFEDRIVKYWNLAIDSDGKTPAHGSCPMIHSCRYDWLFRYAACYRHLLLDSSPSTRPQYRMLIIVSSTTISTCKRLLFRRVYLSLCGLQFYMLGYKVRTCCTHGLEFSRSCGRPDWFQRAWHDSLARASLDACFAGWPLLHSVQQRTT